MTSLEHIKEEKRIYAQNWAVNGWLTVSQVARIFKKSDACIRKWYSQGKLIGAKEDKDIPQSPVHITLDSVLSRIEKFNFV